MVKEVEKEGGGSTAPIITISDVLEYLFCPQFIYYERCLDIPQHEEKRFKVLKGREVHASKLVRNKDYIRKKLGCVRKELSVFLSSKKHCIKGIVDEVLFLDDGTAAPLEYKFAEYKGKIFRTYRYQLILQGLLIRENYGVEVNRGYICYTRSNNLVKEVKIRSGDFEKAIWIVNAVLDITEKCFYPEKITKYSQKCIDCCYRNICC